jgi:hypothetical protein
MFFFTLRGEKRTYIGFTQTADFGLFVGSFFAREAKKNLQKKKSTMLPQAIGQSLRMSIAHTHADLFPRSLAFVPASASRRTM